MALMIDSAAVAERLAGALRFKTISYAEQEKIDGVQFFGLHEHLRKSFPLAAAQLHWETVMDYSLLLTWKGKAGGKPVALLAHLDVVPVNPGTEGDWQHDAFAGHVDGTHVWGRGALDMKGHLVCVLEAVEGLLAGGFRPESDVYLCFGHNEEIVSVENSGAKAMAMLLHERGVKLDLVVDEGGDVLPGQYLMGTDGLIAVVGTAEKGYMDVSLSCAQEGGHASQPPASTALGILARAVFRLEKHPARPRLIGTVQSMMAAAAQRMGPVKRSLFGNLWLFRPLVLRAFTKRPMTNAMVRTTLAATMASGSPAPNVLPQKAEIVVNVRLLPGEDMEGELARMRRVIGDERVSVELIKGKNPSAESSTETEWYGRIADILGELYPGIVVAPYLMVGGTDSCLYEQVCDNIYRIAPFVLGKEDLSAMHGTNERISLENLARGVEFFSKLLMHC